MPVRSERWAARRVRGREREGEGGAGGARLAEVVCAPCDLLERLERW